MIPITFFIILILGIVSIYYIQFTQNNVKRISTNHLQSLGYITKDRITDFLQYKQEEVSLFNSHLLLQNTLVKYSKNKSKKYKLVLKSILKSSYTKHGYLEDIIILDINANIITSK